MIYSLFVLSIFTIVNFLSLFATSKSDFLDKQYEIYPHWSMGCNNLNQCTAIGYPDDEQYNEQEWYVKIEWNSDEKDNGNFSMYFREYSESKILKLCYNNEKCDYISGQVVEKDNILGKRKYLEVKIQKTNFSKYQYILFDSSFQSEIEIPKLELKGFLENYKNLKSRFKIKLQNSKTTYNWTDYKYVRIDEIKELYPEIPIKDECLEENDCSGAYFDECLSGNIILHYENGDNILFLCEDVGIRNYYSVYRDKGTGYEPFALMTTAYENEIAEKFGYGLMYSDSITGLFINPYDKTIIHSTNNYGIWFCGHDMRLAYDGEKFVINSINVMPFCSSIVMEDWISIYKIW